MVLEEAYMRAWEIEECERYDVPDMDIIPCRFFAPFPQYCFHCKGLGHHYLYEIRRAYRSDFKYSNCDTIIYKCINPKCEQFILYHADYYPQQEPFYSRTLLGRNNPPMSLRDKINNKDEMDSWNAATQRKFTPSSDLREILEQLKNDPNRINKEEALATLRLPDLSNYFSADYWRMELKKEIVPYIGWVSMEGDYYPCTQLAPVYESFGEYLGKWYTKSDLNLLANIILYQIYKTPADWFDNGRMNHSNQELMLHDWIMVDTDRVLTRWSKGTPQQLETLNRLANLNVPERNRFPNHLVNPKMIKEFIQVGKSVEQPIRSDKDINQIISESLPDQKVDKNELLEIPLVRKIIPITGFISPEGDYYPCLPHPEFGSALAFTNSHQFYAEAIVYQLLGFDKQIVENMRGYEAQDYLLSQGWVKVDIEKILPENISYTTEQLKVMKLLTAHRPINNESINRAEIMRVLEKNKSL